MVVHDDLAAARLRLGPGLRPRRRRALREGAQRHPSRVRPGRPRRLL